MRTAKLIFPVILFAAVWRDVVAALGFAYSLGAALIGAALGFVVFVLSGMWATGDLRIGRGGSKV